MTKKLVAVLAISGALFLAGCPKPASSPGHVGHDGEGFFGNDDDLSILSEKAITTPDECYYDNSNPNRAKPKYPFTQADNRDQFTQKHATFQIIGVRIGDNGFPVQYEVDTTSTTYTNLLKHLKLTDFSAEGFPNYKELIQKDVSDRPNAVDRAVEQILISAPTTDFVEVAESRIPGNNPLNLKFPYYSKVYFLVLNDDTAQETLAFDPKRPHRVAVKDKTKLPPYFGPSKIFKRGKMINFVYMSDAKKIPNRTCSYKYELVLLSRDSKSGRPLEIPIILDPDENGDGSPPPNNPPSWP